LTSPRTWFKARLTAVADGFFTPAFYPEANRLGHRYVYFTQIDVTPTRSKVIVASRPQENSVRMLTGELAKQLLEPTQRVASQQALELDRVSIKCKV
jgi:hypothetical protein